MSPRFWRAPNGSALDLAVLRIAVATILLVSPEPRDALAWASVDHALYVAPEGLGWFARYAPIAPGVVRGAQLVFAASALAAIAGVWARPALALLTASGLYLFAVPQLAGTVTHDMHLFWMTALLAASPCADALAYDARGCPRPAPSPAYGVPLLFARLFLGVVYFFPGFWKLAASGTAWATSDNLRNQMWWKWSEMGGWLPPVRIDQHPALLHAGAFAVIAFELSFPVLALVRRTRLVALAGGLLFHLFAQVFLRIPFVSLWGCYVVLVDWERLARRLRPKSTTTTTTTATTAATVGAVVLALAIVQGARDQMNAWPFACYPTFQWIAGDAMPDLEVEAVDENGQGTIVPHGPRSQREWGTIWSLVGATAPLDDARLRAYARTLRAPPGAARLRLYRAYFSVAPEDRGKAPLRRVLLLEITPAT